MDFEQASQSTRDPADLLYLNPCCVVHHHRCSGLQALQRLRAQGYVKGGTADCSVIAYGDRWYDTHQVSATDAPTHSLSDALHCVALQRQMAHSHTRHSGNQLVPNARRSASTMTSRRGTSWWI